MSDDGADAGHGPLTESLEDLYENAPCGYLSLKPDGRIFKVNLTFARWIAFTPDELVGKRLHDLLNVAGRIFYETHFAPLLRMQGFFNEVALDLVMREGRELAAVVRLLRAVRFRGFPLRATRTRSTSLAERVGSVRNRRLVETFDGVEVSARRSRRREWRFGVARHWPASA